MSDFAHTSTVDSTYDFDAVRFPEQPGCYLMKGKNDRILYVGKAVNLRRRLPSYFRDTRKKHRKIAMIQRIRDIEIILVRNDREALVLESNLIRDMDPPYNSRFTRDDDSYYYIALTDEAFPRLVAYRKRRTNFALQSADCRLAEVFGPYASWRLRNRMLEALRERFPLRTCHRLPTKSCIRSETGACLAPCLDPSCHNTYMQSVSQAVRLLRNPPRRLIDSWTREMKAAAASLDYECARKRRDWIAAFEHARQRQVVERSDSRNLAVVYWDLDQTVALNVHAGKLIGVLGPEAIPKLPAAFREHLGRIRAAIEAERIVLNKLPCEEAAWKGLPIDLPRSSHSALGQLLDIARRNHGYRTAVA